MNKENKNAFALIEFMIREQLGLPVSNSVLDVVLDISRELPDNVNNISPVHAQHLAGRFLKGMDMCGELYALAVAYEIKKDVNRKKEHGSALLFRSRNNNLKTAKEKESYADLDETYLEACDKYAEAKAFRIRVEKLREDFEKAHYLMRKVSENDSESEGLASKFNVDSDSDVPVKEDKWDNFVSNNTRRPWVK